MNRYRSPRLSLVAAALLATSAVVLRPTSAHADQQLPNPPPPPPASAVGDDTYTTTAKMRLSGDVDPRGPRVRRVRIPAICWWAPAPGPSANPAAMRAAYDSGALAAQTYARYAGRPWSPVHDPAQAVATPRAEFVEAEQRAAHGQHLAWYVAVCRSTATLEQYQDFVHSCPVGMFFQVFPAGNPAPPRVEPVSLAMVARDYLHLTQPAIDRNPKITTAGNAALVGLPTWFWVTDPVAVGAPTGQRTIHAQVGDIWADVVATTTGLQITSPAGTTTCPPARATVAWQPGRPETTACTLTFTKASVGYPAGYPVQATATWNATWTGSDHATGPLPTLTRTTTTNIPVAEAQTTVTNQ